MARIMAWPMTRRVERQATRMHEIMERLQVDVLALARLEEGRVYAQARARCISCGTADRCLRWLDGNPTADRPVFCPNLRLFEQYGKRSPVA
jgi:hypothetical protein